MTACTVGNQLPPTYHGAGSNRHQVWCATDVPQFFLARLSSPLKFNASRVRTGVWIEPPDLPPGTFYVPIPADGASDSAVPPSNKKELSTSDGAIYGIGVGIFSAFLVAGLSGFYADYPRLGTVFTLISAIGFIVMISRLSGYRLTAVHALIASIAILVVACASLAYLLWTKPKEVIVHDPPTAEDMAKATAPIIAERDAAIKERNAARQELGAAQQELTADQQELDAARRSVIPPPVAVSPTPQPEWSASEIAARTELWHSIQNAVNAANALIGPVIDAYNYGDYALNIWEKYIKQNRTDYLGGLAEFRKRVSNAADGIRKLRTDHSDYKDVSETIDQPYLAPLLDSIDDFSSAVSALPDPLPPNYPKNIEGKAGAVRVQMKAFADWISNVQSTSKAKLKQLQMMGHK